MTTSRRGFLQSTLALGAAAAVGAPRSQAIEPIHRNGRPHFRLSIAAYSYRDYLTGKLKPPMTLEDYVDLAATLGVDAVEPTAYYFPKEVTPEYLGRLKGRCTRLGLDISGGAVGNNFCLAEPAKLNEEIAKVKQWTEQYSRLGAKAIRIFAGTAPKGEAPEAVQARCVAAIEEACDHAAKFGIYLALENHGGVTATAGEILALVKAVKHPFFGVNLDTGNFRTEDPYGDLAKLAPYAVNVQVKTEIQRRGQKKEEADFGRLFAILREVHYRGYVALEYEAAEDPKTAIPRYIDILRKYVAG